MASRTASSVRPQVREGALALSDADNDIRQVLFRIAWPLAPRITIQSRLHVTGLAYARQ